MGLRVGRLAAGLAILAIGAAAEAQTVPPGAILHISGWSIGGDVRLKF